MERCATVNEFVSEHSYCHSINVAAVDLWCGVVASQPAQQTNGRTEFVLYSGSWNTDSYIEKSRCFAFQHTQWNRLGICAQQSSVRDSSKWHQDKMEICVENEGKRKFGNFRYWRWW